MSTPEAGAEVNCNLFVVPETILYDPETPPVVGCWTTPLSVTNKLSLFGTFCVSV